MISGLKIKYFKAFESASLDIKPITLIFGKNSSGKSSILKLLQLLRATADKPGPGGIVPSISPRHGLDLGHYRNYVHKNDLSRDVEISISYKFDSFDGVDFSHEQNPSVFYWNSDNNMLSKAYLFDSDNYSVVLSLSNRPDSPAGLVTKIARNESDGSSELFKIEHSPELGDRAYLFRHMRLRKKAIYEHYLSCREMIQEGFKIYADWSALNSADPKCLLLQKFATEFGYDPIYESLTTDHLIIGGWMPGDITAAKNNLAKHKPREQGQADNKAAIERAMICIRSTPEYKHALSELKKTHENTLAFFSNSFTYEDFASRCSVSEYCTKFKYSDGGIFDSGVLTSKPPEDLFLEHYGRSIGAEEPDYGTNCGSLQYCLYMGKGLDGMLGSNGDDKKLSPQAKLGRIICPDLAKNLGHMIQKECASIYCIGPARAEPKDVYRNDVADKHVGFRGENTASLLCLDAEVVEVANSWLDRFCGYKVNISNLGPGASGYFTLSLSSSIENDTRKDRFNDVGYGVSQMLPIIVQGSIVKDSIITIEQPELHVHPALQADMAEYFADSFKKNNNHFVIETHSEHLMLRIQKLIRKGEISADDVSVLYVNRGENGSNINQIRLDKDGRFFDLWPGGGFFPERFNEMMPD